MIITVIGKFRDGTDKKQLTPEAPFEWICDNEKSTFSTLVYLGRNDSETNWRDAMQEEFEEWRRKQDEPIPEEEATPEDYQQALERLGVEVE